MITLITSNDIESVIRILETDSNTHFKWLSLNILTSNPVKSHMLLSCPNVKLFPTVDGNKIINRKKGEALR